MAAAKKRGKRRTPDEPAGTNEIEPDVIEQTSSLSPARGLEIRGAGAKAELAWGGIEQVLAAIAAAQGAPPRFVALALVERVRFRLGGEALRARLSSAASSSDVLRIRGPASALQAIAAHLEGWFGEPGRIELEVRKSDPEILRGWIPW